MTLLLRSAPPRFVCGALLGALPATSALADAADISRALVTRIGDLTRHGGGSTC